jgi:N-acetylglucosamine kinase-like BadF-type ATPase
LQAGDAPVIFETAQQGDPVAQELVRWAGRELGDLAVGVIRQLGFENDEFEVILSGSFWKGSPVVAEEAARVVKAVAPRATFVRLNAPPVAGGVLLGMEMAGRDPLKVQARVLDTASSLV